MSTSLLCVHFMHINGTGQELTVQRVSRQKSLLVFSET
jgi:hypothetical protein